MDIYQESVELHRKHAGKLEIKAKVSLKDKKDLSLAYTPGVAEVCRVIAKDRSKAKELTIKKNMVAVVSDGSAVLGLGNIGGIAGLPVMEGKAILFKEFGGVDAFPICLETQDTEEIIMIVKNIAPVFAGINLEDISAPRCFEIESRLQDIGIPVFHDDQHGTAIVLLAAFINAVKVAKKKMSDLKVVINGAGAAGVAVSKLLTCYQVKKPEWFDPVKDTILVDSKGIISKDRKDLNESKKELLKFTNPRNIHGSLADAMKGADVFIGVSVGNLLNETLVRSMAPNPIIFAMANPTPEVMPDDAKKWGAYIIGTGRSDFPNQINNLLAFPGIFRGAIDAGATKITAQMKFAAAQAIAESVKEPTVDCIVPSPLLKEVGIHVGKKVKEAALKK